MADNNDKRFYSELKTIIGPTPTNVSPLRNEDDQLLTGKSEILDCWKQHFDSLLNRDTEVAATALNVLSPLLIQQNTDDTLVHEEIEIT